MELLARHGASRRRRSCEHQSPRRYEWAEAGALLHIDASSVAKFNAPGHWATDDRWQAQRSRGVGKTVVVGVEDDHTRLAYCELHSAGNTVNAAATLRRVAAWFRDQGCGPAQAVMSDNAKCYSTESQVQPSGRGPRRPPHHDLALHPAWERQDRALPWDARLGVGPRACLARLAHPRPRAVIVLRFYNRRRVHSAAGGRPPTSRVHQVRRQNN